MSRNGFSLIKEVEQLHTRTHLEELRKFDSEMEACRFGHRRLYENAPALLVKRVFDRLRLTNEGRAIIGEEYRKARAELQTKAKEEAERTLAAPFIPIIGDTVY